MIELLRGDILSADAEALVNTVNSVGVMGRGIALQFRKAFPDNFRAYRAACKAGQVRPGALLVHRLDRLENPRFIINFPTKEHWRGNSRMEYIESGLEALVTEIRRLGIKSIAVPPLGCGLGGLDWPSVRERIEHAFAPLSDVRVLLFEPAGAPEPAAMAKSAQRPRMTPGRAVLLSLVHRYLSALLDPFISLLEIHKTMYFAQAAGEPLKLEYTKAVYGPYAKNLRHVLNELEGHWIQGFGDAEDAPEREITLLPSAAERAQRALEHQPETLARFERVLDLIHGFETPFGMELLATVHWVGAEEGASTVAEAIEGAYAWNERKRQFSEEQLTLAWTALADKGWLPNGTGARR